MKTFVYHNLMADPFYLPSICWVYPTIFIVDAVSITDADQKFNEMGFIWMDKGKKPIKMLANVHTSVSFHDVGEVSNETKAIMEFVNKKNLLTFWQYNSHMKITESK